MSRRRLDDISRGAARRERIRRATNHPPNEGIHLVTAELIGEVKIMTSVEECIASLEMKLAYAKYHCSEATRLLREANMKGVDTEASIQDRIGCSAEIVALVSVLHSCADVVAYCTDLLLPPGIKRPRNLYLTSFRETMNPELVGWMKTNYPRLQELITKLLDDHLFVYVSDFVNVSKHRSVISISTGHAFISPWQRIKFLQIDCLEKDGRTHSCKGVTYVTERVSPFFEAWAKDVIEYLRTIG